MLNNPVVGYQNTVKRASDRFPAMRAIHLLQGSRIGNVPLVLVRLIEFHFPLPRTFQPYCRLHHW